MTDDNKPTYDSWMEFMMERMNCDEEEVLRRETEANKDPAYVSFMEDFIAILKAPLKEQKDSEND